eukprot:c25118_g3_i1 orf=206-628(-)
MYEGSYAYKNHLESWCTFFNTAQKQKVSIPHVNEDQPHKVAKLQSYWNDWPTKRMKKIGKTPAKLKHRTSLSCFEKIPSLWRHCLAISPPIYLFHTSMQAMHLSSLASTTSYLLTAISTQHIIRWAQQSSFRSKARAFPP